MSSNRPTVLYIEDDEGDRFFMQRAFAAAGLAALLQTVPDGEAALQYLSGTPPFTDRALYPVPSVLLLDLKLPHVSGFQVLTWVRQHPDYRSLPVIVFSSSGRPEDRIRAKELRASDFWEKPRSGLLYSNIVTLLREKWLPRSELAPAGSSGL